MIANYKINLPQLYSVFILHGFLKTKIHIMKFPKKQFTVIVQKIARRLGWSVEFFFDRTEQGN